MTLCRTDILKMCTYILQKHRSSMVRTNTTNCITPLTKANHADRLTAALGQ